MKNIKCFKGIDNKVYMFGLNPADFLIVLFMVLPDLLMLSVIQSRLGVIPALLAAGGFLGGLYLFAKSDFIKNRPRSIHRYIALFLKTPARLSIPARGELLNGKH